MSKRSGFTLIELLVVIAIIGILATLVITQVAGAQVRARNAQAKSDVTEGGKSVELFRADDANSSGNAIAVTADTTLSGTGGATSGGTPLIPTMFTGVTSVNSLTYGASLLKTPTGSHIFTYESGTQKVTGVTTSATYSLWTQVATGSGVTDTAFCVLNGASINGSSATGAPTGCAL